ncbi:MAG TPA: prepilin-type N-terminal cleavage/methylation domain-containing protein [Xanthobacteraceae bacterium]|jgi:general secretion pathway protein I|nr:prepilin-type N-terminal cleavage/methylation domain-containing protein [Xanthobacteraceae bacterium]
MWCRIARSEIRPPRGTAGFTLIEVLVAIAVLAVVLGAIGAVVGNTVRTIRSVDRRLPLLETAQSLIASLPARNALQPGTQSGTSGEFRWRIDAVLLNSNVPDNNAAAALSAAATGTPPKVSWMPLAITVRVQGSEGPPVRLDTVRLIPRPPG